MKDLYDSVLKPLGFELADQSVDGVFLYSHCRAPIFLSVRFQAEKHRCRMSYQMSSGDFGELCTKTILDKDLIIDAMNGFKKTLDKLGIK